AAHGQDGGIHGSFPRPTRFRPLATLRARRQGGRKCRVSNPTPTGSDPTVSEPWGLNPVANVEIVAPSRTSGQLPGEGPTRGEISSPAGPQGSRPPPKTWSRRSEASKNPGEGILHGDRRPGLGTCSGAGDRHPAGHVLNIRKCRRSRQASGSGWGSFPKSAD